jgi:EmrB/QacA subfamily drug resistance transporter
MDTATVHRRRWATLGVLCLSLMIIGLDNTILNVALPTLVRDLHATESQLQWVVDGYTLVFAGLLLTAGSLGDRFSRRGALAAGLLVFGAGSVAAALCQTPGQLIAARCLMGVGGAFIMPSTLSVLTNTFRDPRERAKAIGIWSGVAGLGIVLGPALGGWLLERFWWGSVFLINVPVAVAVLVLGYWLVPDSRDPSAPRIDLPGALLSTVGLVSLVWAIIEAPSRGWTSTAVLGAFAVAAAVLLAFAWWEIRTPEPMLNLRFFRDPRFSAAALSIALLFLGLFGAVFILTQYLQFVFGYSALDAGIRIMPVATIAVGSPLAVKLMERVGMRLVVTAGMLITTSALGMFGTTSIHDGYGRAAIALATLGFGMGMVFAPATEAVMASLPAAKAGVGSAVNDTVRQVGGAFGVAVLGSVLSSGFGRELATTVNGPVPDAAKDGLGAALAAAGQLPAQAGQAFAAAAREAFVHAMNASLLVAAAITAAGAIVALVWMPGRAATQPAGPDRALDRNLDQDLDRELEHELADLEAVAAVEH